MVFIIKCNNCGNVYERDSSEDVWQCPQCGDVWG